MPSLRERKEDIPLFVSYFLNKFNKELKKNIKEIKTEVLEALKSYDWPGNVRELQNVIERAVALSKEKESLNSILIDNHEYNIQSPKKIKEATALFEKNYIKRALAQTRGNQTDAAKILGIHRTTLISKMEQLGLK